MTDNRCEPSPVRPWNKTREDVEGSRRSASISSGPARAGTAELRRTGRCAPITERQRGGCARECTCPPCTSVSARTRSPDRQKDAALVSAPVTEGWRVRDEETRRTHIFPTKGLSALAAVDVPHGVVASRHLPVVGLTLDYVHTARVAWRGGSTDRGHSRTYTQI